MGAKMSAERASQGRTPQPREEAGRWPDRAPGHGQKSEPTKKKTFQVQTQGLNQKREGFRFTFLGGPATRGPGRPPTPSRSERLGGASAAPKDRCYSRYTMSA